MKAKIFYIKFLFCFFTLIKAQNNRLYNYNQIGWYNYFGTFKLHNKISLHTEYQFRRTNFITNWQQSLLRVGLNYQIHQSTQIRIGYGNIETFSYGKIPINKFGKTFTENRSFVVVTTNHNINKLEISHRYMLEQRWLGQFKDSAAKHEDYFSYSNRVRYQIRLQIPLNKTDSLNQKQFYIATYNELFVGFGKNVVESVFDQNRIGALIGYRINKHIKFELGYLNQLVHLNRRVNNKNIFQSNQGVILNLNFNY
ncbi:MAG: DUF2490 domain-containing protein [Bacteroidia bacterium]